jgi:hypothetical protein
MMVVHYHQYLLITVVELDQPVLNQELSDHR